MHSFELTTLVFHIYKGSFARPASEEKQIRQSAHHMLGYLDVG